MKKSKRKIIHRKFSKLGELGGKAGWDSSSHTKEEMELRTDRMVYGHMRKRNLFLAEMRIIRKYGGQRAQELIIVWEGHYKVQGT